jgi:hypothetical protein
VYFAVREDLRLASANELFWLVKWPYFFLHKLDQPQPRSLHINAMRYVELGMPIDV